MGTGQTGACWEVIMMIGSFTAPASFTLRRNRLCWPCIIQCMIISRDAWWSTWLAQTTGRKGVSEKDWPQFTCPCKYYSDLLKQTAMFQTNLRNSDIDFQYKISEPCFLSNKTRWHLVMLYFNAKNSDALVKGCLVQGITTSRYHWESDTSESYATVCKHCNTFCTGWQTYGSRRNEGILGNQAMTGNKGMKSSAPAYIDS